MQKVSVTTLICWLLFFSGNNPVHNVDKLEWKTLAEAEALCKSEKRPILIDLYTDWCGWCKVMDKKTYSNKNVIQYIQDNFYPVKLDAETKAAIAWSGKNYRYSSANRVNDIAIFLTGGQLSFPTTVIIPTDDSGPQAIPGYLTPKEIEGILKYFGEKKYGKVPFGEYHRQFSPSW